MLLEGSCHCRKVTFEVEADGPCPYQLCYCGICRKVNGSGGYGINISARTDSLKVKGEENISIYRAKLWDDADAGEAPPESSGQRNFCRTCGAGLWLFDPNWPDLIHPYASAIDTDLPRPPSRTHILLGSKASWIEPHIDAGDIACEHYPDETIADWHARMKM